MYSAALAASPAVAAAAAAASEASRWLVDADGAIVERGVRPFEVRELREVLFWGEVVARDPRPAILGSKLDTRHSRF